MHRQSLVFLEKKREVPLLWKRDGDTQTKIFWDQKTHQIRARAWHAGKFRKVSLLGLPHKKAKLQDLSRLQRYFQNVTVSTGSGWIEVRSKLLGGGDPEPGESGDHHDNLPENFTSMNIPQDGNCLLHAICFAIQWNRTVKIDGIQSAEEMNNAAVLWMTENHEAFASRIRSQLNNIVNSKQFATSERNTIKNTEESPFLDIDVFGDGACLFHAIALGCRLNVNSEISHQELRNVATSYLNYNRELYAEKITAQIIDFFNQNRTIQNPDNRFCGIPDVFKTKLEEKLSAGSEAEQSYANSEEGIGDYINHMFNPATWGGEIELGVLAKLLQLQFLIYDGKEAIEPRRPFIGADEAPKVHLLFDGSHYGLRILKAPLDCDNSSKTSGNKLDASKETDCEFSRTDDVFAQAKAENNEALFAGLPKVFRAKLLEKLRTGEQYIDSDESIDDYLEYMFEPYSCGEMVELGALAEVLSAQFVIYERPSPLAQAQALRPFIGTDYNHRVYLLRENNHYSLLIPAATSNEVHQSEPIREQFSTRVFEPDVICEGPIGPFLIQKAGKPPRRIKSIAELPLKICVQMTWGGTKELDAQCQALVNDPASAILLKEVIELDQLASEIKNLELQLAKLDYKAESLDYTEKELNKLNRTKERIQKQNKCLKTDLTIKTYALINKLGATEARNREWGCIHCTVVQNLFKSEVLAKLFEVEKGALVRRKEAYDMRNKLMDILAREMGPSKRARNRVSGTAMRQFVENVYKRAKADLTEQFSSPEESEALCTRDVSPLLYWCQEIAERLPGLQYVEGKRCTQKLFSRVMKRAGNDCELQRAIFRRAVLDRHLQPLFTGYRMCPKHDNFTMSIYAAVRALQDDQEALFNFIVFILGEGNSHALVGASFCWHEMLTKPTQSQSTKPNYFKGKDLYSVLTLAVHRFNREYRKQLLFAIMAAFERGCNNFRKVRGLMAFLYNLSQTQPDIKERSWYALWEDKFRVELQSLLTILVDALEEPGDIERFVIFWFSLPVKIASFFFGKDTGNIKIDPDYIDKLRYPVQILEEKLKKLSSRTRDNIKNHINDYLDGLKADSEDIAFRLGIELLRQRLNEVFDSLPPNEWEKRWSQIKQGCIGLINWWQASKVQKEVKHLVTLLTRLVSAKRLASTGQPMLTLVAEAFDNFAAIVGTLVSQDQANADNTEVVATLILDVINSGLVQVKNMLTEKKEEGSQNETSSSNQQLLPANSKLKLVVREAKRDNLNSIEEDEEAAYLPEKMKVNLLNNR